MKKTYTPQVVSNYLQPPKKNCRASRSSFFNDPLKKYMLAAVLFTAGIMQSFAQDGETCATAINLQTLTSPYSSTTVGKAHNFTPSCNDSGTAPDLYFYIDLLPGYAITGTTAAANGYDAVTYIGYGGECPGTQITCTDNDNETFTRENNSTTTQRLYWIQDGWDQNSGAFTLTWSLTAPPACNIPSAISATLVTPTVANISWAAPVTGTATGYEYAITESETPPAIGTATTATALPGITVTLNRYTYVHVRSYCSTDGYSEWATYAFYSGICVPGSSWTGGFGITNVTMGNINNTTRLEDNNYGDFSDQVANVGIGTTQQFSISLATDSEAYDVRMWADWNNNLAFDAGEEIYNGTSSNADASTLTGSFVVPATATLGNIRLRVGGIPNWTGDVTPCLLEGSSVFEDYTLNVVPAPTCYEPAGLTTTNTAPGVISINWNAPTQGAPAGYEYAITETRSAPASGTTVTATSAAGITVTTNVTGYVQVRASCGNGDYSQWVLLPFYNGVCIPAPTGVNQNGITNVTIGTINNTTTTEANQYGNYSNLAVSVGQGVTQQFSITINTNQEYDTRVWVDWNNDLDFDDAGEEVYSAIARVADAVTLNGTFTVPVTASLGNHRLRVGTTPTWADDPASPCYSGNWGTFEDYTVNVTTAPSCYAPTNTAAVNVTTGTVNLSWTAPTLGGTVAGYEYAITTTPAAPASGTAVTTTTVNSVTVTTEVASYLHVRTNCGSGDYSQWVTIPFYNGVCLPTSPDMEGDGITNVTIGSINNTTGLEDGNYGDFTNQVVTVGQSVTQQLSVTLTTGVSFDTRVWVDWNNDLDFDDTGEEVFSGQSREVETSTLSGTFTVPATAALGNHRLRVGAVRHYEAPATPCYTDHYGTYEDYTINVTTPPSCFMPAEPVAQNTAAGLVTISWTAQTLGTTPTGYEYAVNTTATAPQSGTAVTTTRVTGVTATPNATNYLHVRTNCGSGNYSEWLTVAFYNGYCVPEPTSVNGRGITNVTMGSINNSTPDRTIYYGDYTDQVLTIGQTVTQRFRISFRTSATYDTRIWVDWNNDLDFDDAGEQIYRGASADAESYILAGAFTIPATAPLGSHRLRIGAVPAEEGDATPCFTSISSFGNYEDYTINITVPPTCFTPVNLVGVGIASGNANLSWTAPTLGGTPAGYEYAVTTSQTPPASGTAVTATFVTGYTNIEDGVYYYLHVRTNCGGSDFSQWDTSEPFRYLAGSTCATAIDLGTQISPYTSTTDGAGNAYSPECQDNTAPELFYSLEVPNGYTVAITLENSDYDSFHVVFLGGCNGSNQTVLECTDDDDGTTTWENLTGSSQTIYFVQDGWASDSGEFTLEWELTPPASCDIPREPDVFQTSLTSTNVSWIAPNTGSPTGYEYAVTTSGTPPATGTLTTQLSVTGVPVTPNTDSYLHVRSVCGEEDGNSAWVTYAFFSGYCVPENTGSANHYISGVSTSGGETNFVNNGTGFSDYTDYTATHTVSTYAGGSFAITATAPTADEYLYAVWIDWNNNFDFTDDGDRIINSPYLTSPAAVGNIAVPAGTAQGTYRMRIRNALVGAPLPVCGALESGETEDYTLVVGPTPTCFPPFAPTIEPADETTANLRWSPPILGPLPQGYEYVLSNSPATPSGSGTPSASIFIEGVPYNPAQDNYLFVRSTCGEGEFSRWESTAILGTVTSEIANNIMVYKEGNVINITSGNTLMSGITIYDIRGSKLYTQSNINAANTSLTGLQIQQQVVIVEVTTQKGKISKRIVF